MTLCAAKSKRGLRGGFCCSAATSGLAPGTPDPPQTEHNKEASPVLRLVDAAVTVGVDPAEEIVDARSLSATAFRRTRHEFVLGDRTVTVRVDLLEQLLSVHAAVRPGTASRDSHIVLHPLAGHEHPQTGHRRRTRGLE
jgi:hypothetical protein